MDIKPPHPPASAYLPGAGIIGMDHNGQSNSLLDFRSVLASEPNQIDIPRVIMYSFITTHSLSSCQQYGMSVRGDTSLPPNSSIQGSGIGFIHSVDLDKSDRYCTVYLVGPANPLCSAFWPAAPFNG